MAIIKGYSTNPSVCRVERQSCHDVITGPSNTRLTGRSCSSDINFSVAGSCSGRQTKLVTIADSNFIKNACRVCQVGIDTIDWLACSIQHDIHLHIGAFI